MRFRKMEYYIPKLKELYPKLEEETIKLIIKTACAKIMDSIVNNKDVLIDRRDHGLKLLIHKTNYSLPRKIARKQHEENSKKQL